jgi:predicted PurR-regulated permease PerM
MPNAFAQLTLRRIARWGLVLTAILLVSWLLWSARSALTPFIIGFVLAYLFLPLVNRLDGRVPRWAAILLVYLAVLGVVATFFAFLVPPLVEQFSELIRALPDLPTVQGWVNLVIAEYEQLLDNLPEGLSAQVRETVAGAIAQAAETLRSNFISYLQSVGTFLVDSMLSVANTVSFLLGFFLIPFWLFYVLMDQHAGVASLNQILPPWLRTDFWTVTTIVDQDFSGYLRGQLILGVAVGTASAVGLSILSLFGLEVPYILLLAVIAGVTELIPIIGPIIGSIPAIILGFTDSPTTGLAVLGLYIAIQQLENNFLVPRIVGESVGLHPSVLMVLLVVCAQVFGILGAILSAPLGAVSRDVFNYLYGRLSEPPMPAGLLPERMREAGVSVKVIAKPPVNEVLVHSDPPEPPDSAVVDEATPHSTDEEQKSQGLVN